MQGAQPGAVLTQEVRTQLREGGAGAGRVWGWYVEPIGHVSPHPTVPSSAVIRTRVLSSSVTSLLAMR